MENEIPKEMVAAAADSIWNSTAKSKSEALGLAISTLEAAGVPRLLEQIASMQAWRDEESADRAAANARIAELEAELSKHQESEFHPDWSLLDATRGSLREAQKRIAELEAKYARLEDRAMLMFASGFCEAHGRHVSDLRFDEFKQWDDSLGCKACNHEAATRAAQSGGGEGV